MKARKKNRTSSHKSKQTEEPFSTAPTNGTISSPPPEDDQSGRSKRKRDSESGHKKQNKKKRHEAEDDESKESRSLGTNNSSVSEDDQGQTLDVNMKLENPSSEDTREPDQNASGGAALPEGSPDPTSDVTRSDRRPRKARGYRIGGKNQQKVGFFIEEEVKALEQFKIRFCNTHGIQGRTFDAMVQHSERGGDEWPVTTNICTKADFWNDIYALIPDRDRRSVYRFMRRHFQDTTQKAHDWTPEQDEELIRLHAQHGPKYAHIAKLLGRSDDDVTQRWKNRLQHRATKNTGAWSEAELRVFVRSLEEYRNLLLETSAEPQKAGKDIWEMDLKSISWGSISNGMGNSRTRQQCADKWRKIQKNLMTIRQTIDPNAVFDPAEAAKKYHRSNSSVASGKSKKFVEDDDDDVQDDDDEETRIPSTTPAIIPKLEFTAEQQAVDLARVAREPSVGADIENSDEGEAATPSSPISEDSSIEEKKLREERKERKRKKKEKKERKRREAEAAAAAAADEEEEEDEVAEDIHINSKEKKNKDKNGRKSEANGTGHTESSKKKGKKEKKKNKKAAEDGAGHVDDMSDVDGTMTV